MDTQTQQPEVRGTVHRLEGADMTLAYDDCPEPGFPLQPRIERAKNELLAFDAKVAAIKKDPNLSPAGREDALRKLEPDRAKVRVALEKVEEEAHSLEALGTELEAAVFETPALEPSDVNGRMDDAEIRAWYASLTPDQRRRYLDEVVAGRNARHALALARSPVPTMERQIGLAALRANLPKEDLETLKRVEARKVAVAWTRSATGVMRRALARKNGGGSTA